MEATGIYHEAFAQFLFDKNQKVSIVLPHKICSYARTLDVKTVTDKSAANACEQPYDNYTTGVCAPLQFTPERPQLILMAALDTG